MTLRFILAVIIAGVLVSCAHEKKVLTQFDPAVCPTCVTAKTSLKRENLEALKKLENIKESEVTPEVWEMTHFRKGELYYTLGLFDTAIACFAAYIEKFDVGIYKMADFRAQALDLIAVCFSDMQKGAQKAIAYFGKTGPKNYEAQVFYTIGMKEHAHGQFDNAFLSLSAALKRFPYYKEAPAARQMIIESYSAKKEFAKANSEEERLVDDFSPGSSWYEKNKDSAQIIEQSRFEIKKAIGSIGRYYYSKAQERDDSALYTKALKRFEEFFHEFPQDAWWNYEFHFCAAEIYSLRGNCEQARRHYDYVASQDITKFPGYKPENDSLRVVPVETECTNAKTVHKPVIITRDIACYYAIVALQECRKKKMATLGIDEEHATDLPETKALLDAIQNLTGRFPQSPYAAEALYAGAVLHYNAKSFEQSILMLETLIENYPQSASAGNAQSLLTRLKSSIVVPK